MALEAPLWSSAGSFPFRYSAEEDSMASHPADPERPGSPYARIKSPSSSAVDSGLLRPGSVNRIPSNAATSPNDLGPSPVTSIGTGITDIDDDISVEVERDEVADSQAHRPELFLLGTNVPSQSSPDEAVSVIHAPESFASWTSADPTHTAHSNQPSEASSPKDNSSQMSSSSHHSVSSPPHPYRPAISTNIRPVRYNKESATPRAQDLQDMLSESSRGRSNSTVSLEKIDEQTEAEIDDDHEHSDPYSPRQSDEVTALRTALSECWLLCKTMAGLSSSQRARSFRNSGTPDPREKAWGACWKLCQCLYESQGEKHRPEFLTSILEQCRDFCQALFDVRDKQDEMSDSILRVSFELNNHLYTAQGVDLPDEFQKRTLDFYTTLCHRLMRQRVDLQGEADQLLRACWDLTETLFNLWQVRLDKKPPSEESLGTAVQACWELCDLFKRSCKQIRPDKASTPRSSQSPFLPLAAEQTGRESRQSNRSRHSKRESVKSIRQDDRDRPRKSLPVPETPVTEFEDTPVSPDRSPTVPNLMVLGTTSERSRGGGGGGGGGGRWSSSASTLSGYSHSSARTSSTATTTQVGTEDINVGRAKLLVLRAALNLGFDPDSLADPKTAIALLHNFVQDIPAGAFGPLPAHATLLQQFKNSVLVDSFIPRAHQMPSARGKRVSAMDMAKSVQVLANSSTRYAYLRDLFKLVFQFGPEEADVRRNVSIMI